MGRLVLGGSQTTVTETTSRYNQRLQDSIVTLEPGRRWAAAAQDHSRSTRSAKNRRGYNSNRSWKNPIGLTKLHSRIQDNMNSPSLYQSFCCCWLEIWGRFSCHTLDSSVPTEHRLKSAVDHSLVADHVHPFITTVTILWWHFQQENAPGHKAQTVSNWGSGS